MKRTAIATILCLGLGAMAALILLSLMNGSPPVVAQPGIAHDLTLDVPVLAVSPDRLHVTHQVGEVTTRALTITNEGPAELTFNIVDGTVPGAVLFMHLDESVGATTFQDASGNNHHGSCTGASCPIAGVSGKLGQALSFDGADDYVLVSPFTVGGAVSVEAWVYSRNVYAYYARVIDFGNGPSSDNIILGWEGSSGRMDWEASRDFADSGFTTDEVFPQDQWVHIVAVNDGNGTGHIYWNGVLKKSGSIYAPREVSRNMQYIARSNWGIDAYFDGLIDELAFYDRALSAEEVEALYLRSQGAGDVPWLSKEPISGTVAAYSSQVISITFDATGMQPGVYTTQLAIDSNDPFTPSVTIPISMTVLPSADMGRVAGTVSDAWTGLPITATVELIGVEAQEAAPTYTIWAPAGVYSLSAYAPGYVSTTVAVQIAAGELVTQDLALWPTETRVYLPIVYRGYCPDFFDTFDDPSSGWEVWNDDHVRSEYVNGEYRVLTKRSGYLYLFGAPTCNRVDYDVAVDARWAGEPGGSYGLLFGLSSDYTHYYFFDVNTDYRRFRLYRRTPDGFTAIMPAAVSYSINPGTASNHLSVRRRGSEITLWVNGTQLGTWYDSAIIGPTGVGVMASPYSDVPTADARFDNFSVVTLRTGSAALTGIDGTAVCSESGTQRTPLPAELELWPH
ncbi:MAG: hypothetical protein JXA14_04445 [Anaerolineae bacterium]|nr:hypothetical protein [Anaerolineae bacterium]